MHSYNTEGGTKGGGGGGGGVSSCLDLLTRYITEICLKDMLMMHKLSQQNVVHEVNFRPVHWCHHTAMLEDTTACQVVICVLKLTAKNVLICNPIIAPRDSFMNLWGQMKRVYTQLDINITQDQFHSKIAFNICISKASRLEKGWTKHEFLSIIIVEYEFMQVYVEDGWTIPGLH